MKNETSLKTPITYYGGKQNMLSHILPKFPAHISYIEPFFGGGAVFFGKEPSKAEVINDINHRLVTFYKVLKYDFEELEKLVDETFHSRKQHAESSLVYKSDKDEIHNPISCAWSVWMQTNMSYTSKIGGGFAYDKKGSTALRNFNKKNAFTDAYKTRLKKVTIECYDVLKVIKAYDSPDSFFYLDPPYVSSDQGHYGGYTLGDFKLLLDACANMEGKFLLSSYPEELLMEYRQKFAWKSEDHKKLVSINGKRQDKKVKTECLTWNY